MIKDAIKYIVDELSHAERYMINGDEYSDKQLYRIDPYFPKAKAIGKMYLYDWMEQAKRDAEGTGDMPVVFHKKNRAEILVTMRFDDFMNLYREREAGRK